MTIGVIDPYDIAVRVDLGEIREDDLPKVFSGNTKALAECKRHLYKLRSDRLLYKLAALRDVQAKLQYMTDPRVARAAFEETVKKVQYALKDQLEHIESVNAQIVRQDDASVEYIVSRNKKWRADSQHWNMQEDVILRIKNTVHGSEITPMQGWNNVISKKTFDKVVGQVREINAINENVLGTRERRKVEIDILENETIPFMAKMWGIAVLGDIFEMLGKALGGNL